MVKISSLSCSQFAHVLIFSTQWGRDIRRKATALFREILQMKNQHFADRMAVHCLKLGWMDGWSEWKVPNVDSGIFLNLNALQTSGQYSDCFDGKVLSSKHCHHTFRTLFGLISLKLCSPCQGLTPPKRLDFQFISFNGGRNHSPIKQAHKAWRCDSYLQIWNYHPLQCGDVFI